MNLQGARRLYKLAKNEIKNPPVVQSPVKKKQGTKCHMTRLLHRKNLENPAGAGLAEDSSLFCFFVFILEMSGQAMRTDIKAHRSTQGVVGITKTQKVTRSFARPRFCMPCVSPSAAMTYAFAHDIHKKSCHAAKTTMLDLTFARPDAHRRRRNPLPGQIVVSVVKKTSVSDGGGNAPGVSLHVGGSSDFDPIHIKAWPSMTTKELKKRILARIPPSVTGTGEALAAFQVGIPFHDQYFAASPSAFPSTDPFLSLFVSMLCPRPL
jgi:hypothetical protein